MFRVSQVLYTLKVTPAPVTKDNLTIYRDEFTVWHMFQLDKKIYFEMKKLQQFRSK